MTVAIRDYNFRRSRVTGREAGDSERFGTRKSYEGRMGDALASGSEEGRGKLRKLPGISKHELIRQSPNGTTHRAEGPVPPLGVGQTQGTETSNYLQEKKEKSIL